MALQCRWLIERSTATFRTAWSGVCHLREGTRVLRRIININETKASLDGSNTQAGGHPAMSYRDPHLPQIMKLVAKSSFECTAIFGSSPAG